MLKIMIEEKELNLNAIVKKSMLNYATVTKHLDKLMQYGIVSERRFGNIRMFRLEPESGLTLKMIELIGLAKQNQKNRNMQKAA